jgi:LuxR family maltose regulon positive regulatory protein
MPTPILATKLYVPPPPPRIVRRPRLIERLNEGLHGKLTLVSAPAGFGKTTLVSEWLASGKRPAGWLSLDEEDTDPARFLTYFIAALQTVVADIGEGMLGVLQAPQPPSTDAILTTLLNEVATIPDKFILVLDDYHAIDAKSIDNVLTFLLEHLPPQMHLVIATREDPHLPLARLRARGQLTELRADDLRFTSAEAAGFLNQMMGLSLSADDIAALETRTEGWIAGLQLAALSMQGHQDVTSFIKSFTGSHHFVLDYLMEEVLQQQSESIQTFLLRTSILDRLCGPLCDAVLLDPAASGQQTLEYLERANLFIVPLDSERRWYRYHHLFGDLLRQRLGQSLTRGEISEHHVRASQWYEDNGLGLDAFRHAAAANDVERAERLMEGSAIPRHSHRALKAVVEWLMSLPKSVLDARPLLWVRSATMALMTGQTTGVEERLQAAEEALRNSPQHAQTRDLLGQIAAARATLAVTQYRPDAVIAQAQRALEYLLPENLTFRFTANWTLANAYHLQGDREAAKQAVAAALAICRVTGNMFATILATTNLGHFQELDNQLHVAAETYRRVLHMAGEQPILLVNEVHLGLARIHYEWNDLEAAERHGQQCLQLTRLYDRALDRYIFGQVFLARLQLAQGDVAGAAALLAEAEQSVRQNNFVKRMPLVAAAQVLTLLRQGNLAAAAHLAQTHDLPICRARVLLAQGDASAALAALAAYREQVEAKNWQDERLRVMVLQAVALHAHGAKDEAVQMLGEALALAEPAGFIRLFVDEGEPMRLLIADFRLRIVDRTRGPGHKLLSYVDRLLAAFAQPAAVSQSNVANQRSGVAEPLSQRELEVLRLIAQGLSNREISERLFLALSTVKGHNRIIFDKLQVHSRTEAIARARALGLL